MKLNKRTGAILGFLLAVVGGATAATGWLTNYTWTYDTLKKEPIPAVLVTDDDDGTWTTVKTGTGLTVNGTITASTAGLATSANQDAERTLEGALTETAPATDTASSGLNGRLQRIAQRLTSLIALLPTALGAGGGLKVDGSGTPLPVSGTVTATVAGATVVGIPAPCTSAPLTKLYQTTASRRSMTISLGATYTWAVVTNLDTAKQVGIRLSASDTDPYIIPSGASMPTIYPAAGVANLYADTNTTPASGGSTTYLSIYACP